jgi:hypothetical protein
LYGAQAGLYGAQAAAEPGTAAAQQALYGAQAQNQLAQAANAMNPAQLTVNLQNQTNAMAQSLNQQVQQGKLSPDAATSQFNQWFQTNVEPMKQQIAYQQATQQAALNTAQAQANLYGAQAANYPAALAQTASDAAQKNAIAMMPYQGNPQFGNVLGTILSGGKVSPEQMQAATTMSLPNLQEIGRQGAAQALAGISPTAQMHTQIPGPSFSPPMAGLPPLTSMLNAGSYTFGAPPAAAAAPAVANAGAAPPAAAAAAPGFDWGALLARQQQSAADQAAQAQIAWPSYTPAA